MKPSIADALGVEIGRRGAAASSSLGTQETPTCEAGVAAHASADLAEAV